MKVRAIETLQCDAGWRNYHFVKLTAENGVVGWSEFDEGFGSPGVTAAIARLSGRVIGKSVMAHERIHAELYALTRPAAGGVVAEGIGAIENALLDAKAKTLGVPCYELLGGKIRDRIPLYWSHCATWRISHPAFYKPAITDLAGVKAMGAEVREKGFRALKTNIFIAQDGVLRGWQPGFANPFSAALNIDRTVLRGLRAHLDAFRDGAGSEIDILLDLTSTPRRRVISRSCGRSPISISSGWRSTATTPRRWASSGGGARTPSAPAKRCSASGSSCPISAPRRWTWRSSTQCGTAPGNR